MHTPIYAEKDIYTQKQILSFVMRVIDSLWDVQSKGKQCRVCCKGHAEVVQRAHPARVGRAPAPAC